MLSTYTYKPVQFFLITILSTWIIGFIVACLSYKKDMQKYTFFGIFLGMLMPFIAALIMIYGSKNPELIKDFWDRLFFWKIKPSSFIVILFLMPLTIFLATAISLLFGQSTDQFSLANEYNVIKGRQIYSIVIPFILAPLLEELGWRGYGVDSLRANFNLFTTSMLFAFLWAIWHLPLFFIKGYYQNMLWHQNKVYVINFFISVLPIAILTNWIYYSNSRSILAIVLFHSMLNIFSIIFKTKQFTKCIVTLLLIAVSIIVILNNRSMFFQQ